MIFAISMLSRITPHKLLLTAITPSKLRLMLKATASHWRGPGEPELTSATAPEHFIQLESVDVVGPLPFISGLATAQNNLRPATQSVMPFEPTAEFARNGVNVETMS